MPFSELVRVTVAFGIRAPDGSETEPENAADGSQRLAMGEGNGYADGKEDNRQEQKRDSRKLGHRQGPPSLLNYGIGNCTEFCGFYVPLTRHCQAILLECFPREQLSITTSRFPVAHAPARKVPRTALQACYMAFRAPTLERRYEGICLIPSCV